MIQLRTYQKKAIDELRAAYGKKYRAPLLVSPTGSGKTVMFAYMAKSAMERGKRVYILVHRKELVRQTSASLTAFGMDHGVVAAGRTMTPEHIQVCSIGTLDKREKHLQRIPPDIIILDEAHHAVTGTWKRIVDRYPAAKILGVTATPRRLDGRGLGAHVGGLFDAIVMGPSTAELIDEGHLADYRAFIIDQLKDVVIAKRMGDFDQKKAAEILSDDKIVGDVIGHYMRISPGKPAIAFCPTVAYAERLAEKFQAAGIPSESIDGAMDDGQRKKKISGLASGEIHVLTSCDLISEGVDVPIVTTAILLRKTISEALYLQQVGRVLRTAPGKECAYIIDHVGNIARHGRPDAERDWSLDGKKKRARSSDSETAIDIGRQCEKCFYLMPRGVEICPACGAKKEVSTGEAKTHEVDGDLVEIERSKILEQRSKSIQLKRMLSDAKTPDDIRQIGRQLGYKAGWAEYVIKSRKQRGWGVEGNPPAPVNQQEHQGVSQ